MKKATFLILIPLLMILAFRNADEKPASISYEKRIKPFMDKNCRGCHSPHPSDSYMHFTDLSNYDSLKTYVMNGAVYDHVFVKKDMPPIMGWSLTPRLDSSELVMLDSWIKAGAPFE